MALDYWLYLNDVPEAQLVGVARTAELAGLRGVAIADHVEAGLGTVGPLLGRAAAAAAPVGQVGNLRHRLDDVLRLEEGIGGRDLDDRILVGREHLRDRGAP